MAHAQKPDSVFQRNGRVHLYRRGCQFSRVLGFLECGSGENDCSNTGWTVVSQTEAWLATHSIRLFPLHFSSRASPCATRFRFHSTYRRRSKTAYGKRWLQTSRHTALATHKHKNVFTKAVQYIRPHLNHKICQQTSMTVSSIRFREKSAQRIPTCFMRP